MKKPVFLIFTNAMILVVIFMLLAQSLFLVQRGAQVENVKGQITVQRRGDSEFMALQPGQTVGVGDTIVTNKDGSATFAFSDKTRWKTTPNSRVTISKASVDSIKKSEVSQLRLDSGQIFVRMVKPLSTGSHFEIETPNAHVKITGTILSVKTCGGETEVEVLKGQAQIENAGGKSVQIAAGQEGIAKRESIDIKNGTGIQLVAQTDLTHPDLEVVLLKDDKAIVVRGDTEAGNQVWINQKSVEVLPNGLFFQPQELKNGHNEFKVKTSDRHNESSSDCKAVDFNSKTSEISDSSCR